MAAALSRFEPARILIQLDADEAKIRRLLIESSAALENIELLRIPTNDSWIRDYGPIFVNALGPHPDPLLRQGEETKQRALDFRFNSWGQKYGAFDLDDVVPRALGQRYGFEVETIEMVLEGGSIDVNGSGCLLTTESCLLNPNRNPHMSREEIEEQLKDSFGVEKILWLGDRIEGDDTDGHVDDLARFTDAGTIVTVLEKDPADNNYRVLQDNLRRLEMMKDLQNEPFRIETLPMPPAMHHEGTRLPASYANFYIANGCVLVPTFDCPADFEAIATLQRLFPNRKAIGIHCTDLVWGLGAIHCLTQQHPTA
jgi:agmatine deiminase